MKVELPTDGWRLDDPFMVDRGPDAPKRTCDGPCHFQVEVLRYEHRLIHESGRQISVGPVCAAKLLREDVRVARKREQQFKDELHVREFGDGDSCHCDLCKRYRKRSQAEMERLSAEERVRQWEAEQQRLREEEQRRREAAQLEEWWRDFCAEADAAEKREAEEHRKEAARRTAAPLVWQQYQHYLGDHSGRAGPALSFEEWKEEQYRQDQRRAERDQEGERRRAEFAAKRTQRMEQRRQAEGIPPGWTPAQDTNKIGHTWRQFGDTRVVVFKGRDGSWGVRTQAAGEAGIFWDMRFTTNTEACKAVEREFMSNLARSTDDIAR